MTSTDRIMAQRDDVYVPGRFTCPLCGFVLMSKRMSVRTGALSPNRDSIEECPNDGTMMRPALWREVSESVAETLEQITNLNPAIWNELVESRKQRRPDVTKRKIVVKHVLTFVGGQLELALVAIGTVGLCWLIAGLLGVKTISVVVGLILIEVIDHTRRFRKMGQ